MTEERKQLRERRLYWIPAGQWVGFGDAENDQPDLFFSRHRFAWWHVHVCRVCLVTALRRGAAFVDQAEALLTQPRKVVAKKKDAT